MARKGLYTQTFTLPSGKRKYVTAKTKAELEEKVFQLKLQLRLGIDLDDRTTVGELLQIWFDAEQKDRVRDTSADATRQLIERYILPFLSPYQVRDVTPLVIQNYLKTLSRICKGSASRCLSILRGAFNIAVENKLIQSSPVLSRFKAPGKTYAPRRALDEEQQELLLFHLRRKRRKDTWLFAQVGLYTGLRAGEILGLCWDAVDFSNRVIHVRRAVVFPVGKPARLQDELKTETSKRDVPIPDVLLASLKEAKMSTNSLFLFPAKDGGIPDKSVLARYRYTLKSTPLTSKLGVLVTPHILRHSYATRLFEAGLDVTEIQHLLGHSKPTTTLKIYIDYCDNRKKPTFDRARKAMDNCTTPVPQVMAN